MTNVRLHTFRPSSVSVGDVHYCSEERYLVLATTLLNTRLSSTSPSFARFVQLLLKSKFSSRRSQRALCSLPALDVQAPRIRCLARGWGEQQ